MPWIIAAFETIIIVWLFFLLIRYRKRLHKTTGKYKYHSGEIQQVSIQDFHPSFKFSQFGPGLDSEAKIILRAGYNVTGGTSDFEAWILAVLSKSSENMFEFGTCTGKTTYLWASNSSTNAKIVTLTLPPDNTSGYKHSEGDSVIARENAISESSFTSFFYSGTEVEYKISQLFLDSKDLDENYYKESFDLIFIDGSHAYSYIKNDTEKAMKMIKKGGIVLWHDYNKKNEEVKDVYRYLNDLSRKLPLVHIQDTTLVGYKFN